ncbi:unnamed protein product [Zymoseptoria tritici ST99CH_3D7]|uniref:4Fe-4S ferredoxin-type domain-containing protein n=2 Tax=Zymoseptoria tritici TaxID=1047171 RepID=A0A1X7RIH9_ZYMT9|nr:unnamed protein product [Zymoseptoria tritici ST99CH_3D7]SMR43387.1 unnamed protein product [Zymoseptoria tritici ST99CH_1E4]
MRSTLAFLLLLFVSPPLALGTCPYVCNCCPLQGGKQGWQHTNSTGGCGCLRTPSGCGGACRNAELFI